MPLAAGAMIIREIQGADVITGVEHPEGSDSMRDWGLL